MIEITRALARQLRAVLRKAVPIGSGRSPRPPLVFQAGKDGLRIRSHDLDVAVEFHLPGSRSTDVVALPGDALDHFEGRKDDTVTLEVTEPGTVQARWDDEGMPQARSFTSPDPDKLPPFPEQPKKLFPVDVGILKALEDACQTAARDAVRYAVQRLQLRGATGDIVATDGRQLLIQGGFALPWKEDILIPAVPVFGCRELPPDRPVAIGKTDTHICIQTGPWTFFLAIDKDGRFPDTKAVIPAAAGATVCRLAAEDAGFLAKALPRLPGRSEDNQPLTVDLNGHVAIRARAADQGQPTEVVLSRSEVVGPPVRFVSNRQFLARALALGFCEIRVLKADAPVVCTDRLRTYLWVPLGKDGALPPSDDAVRITSAGDEPVTNEPKIERKVVTKPTANVHTNGHTVAPSAGSREPAPNGTGAGVLIAEAQALREVLHDAYGRSRRLVAALKRQRRQSRLMTSTLTALKQLQHIEG